MTPNYLFNPTPADDVAGWIKAKLPLSKAQFENLLPELQARAFVVSGIHAFDALQDIRDTVAKLPEGALFKNLQKEIASKLANYIDADQLDLVPRDAEEMKDYETKLQRRAGFLLRHHGNQAYAVAVHQDLEEHGDVFTHWKYLTVGDGHVRDTHRALDGLILPKSHEFWKTHFPPWQFGCRCQVVPVTSKEYEAYVKLDEGKAIVDRFTLTEAEQLRLTNERKLQRKIAGVETDVDLRSDTEKGAEFPYIFDPASLKMPLASIRDRYDASVWNEFESWAKKTSIQGTQTVWSWMGGEVVRPITATTINSVADLLERLQMNSDDEISLGQVDDMLGLLKKKNPIKASEVFSEIKGNRFLPKQVLIDAAQPLIDLLDPELVKRLPKIKYVAIKRKRAALGSYNQYTKTLEINSAYFNAGLTTDLKTTVMHELIHWAHLESGTIESTRYFKADLQAYFAQRIKNERLQQLNPYGRDVKGYKDEFFDLEGDEYAGRVYSWEHVGTELGYELPTRHLEKIARGPETLLNFLNYRHPKANRLAWREAFIKSLSLFFLKP